jgi:hypothetical protein
MRRELADGYELDDDPGRIDREYVFNYLSLESYWALGRTRDVVERSIAGSSRVVGLYRDGAQVGFARVISDGAEFAVLADVSTTPTAVVASAWSWSARPSTTVPSAI